MSLGGAVVEDVVTLGGREVRFTIRRSARARRLSLRVLPGAGLEVVLPRGFSLREASTFVRRNQGWVLRQLDRAATADAPAGLTDGGELPYLGGTLTLRVVADASRNTARLAGGVLTVTLTPGTSPAAVVEAWYRSAARRVCVERAAIHTATLGVQHGRITIKDTRSRWGSCSSKGNLNFSWRLLLAPDPVLDYVVAHEVAHLLELNHSPAFWSHVATVCPNWKPQRAWLRKHGRELAAWPAG
ncbi:MAG: M48 family metallopeptidase [Vicinamibacterales bacterium]